MPDRLDVECTTVAGMGMESKALSTKQVSPINGHERRIAERKQMQATNVQWANETSNAIAMMLSAGEIDHIENYKSKEL